MKQLVYGLLFVFLSCKNPVEETIKNSQPPELSPASGQAIANEQQRLHSFILHQDNVTVMMDGADSLIAYNALPHYIQQNKAAITKQKLNLVTTESASYQQVVEVLDQMTIHNIQAYELLRYE